MISTARISWILLAPALFTTGLLEGAADPPRPRVVTYPRLTMGTIGTVGLVTTDSASSVADARAGLNEFTRVDSLMSNWTETSEVARINREAGAREVEVHPEVMMVLRFAVDVARQSTGAFDITVEPLVRTWGFLGGSPRLPDPEDVEEALARVGYQNIVLAPDAPIVRFEDPDLRVDLGGVAKGRAVDLARLALQARGVQHGLVDLSGNMAAWGHPPDAEAWVVGIRDPDGVLPYFAHLTLGDGAIATSGDYEQFVADDGRRLSHILDPRTGWPAQGLVSVTVIAPSAMSADAWATAFFVLGLEASRPIARERDDLDVVLVLASGDGTHEVWVESRLRERFRLQHEAASRFPVRYF